VIGQVVGSYRIVAELGRGGMGMVYRAEHVQLGRPAALKMLLPQFSSDATIVQRFFNEARAASAIEHPGIVEIYDFGTHTDGSAYIVMALLRGETLQQRLARGPMAPVEGATILAQVAGALAAAHAQGIVHRDLKPDNIFLVPNELVPGGVQVKLLDFGIAKLADERTAGFKTQTGALIGTPAYMSPEQCMGRSDLDHRTDLYSLGCILFHVLCGRPPFLSEHGTGVMIAAHIRDPAPHPKSLDPRIPDALAALVMRLLEKEPAARFQTAAELRAALVAAGAAAPATRAPGGEIQYAATIAPVATTTRSGAAAEVVAAAPTTSGGGGKAGWIVAAVVLVGAAAAVAFLLGRSSSETPPPAAEPAAAAPAPAPAAAAAPAPAPAPAAAAVAAPAPAPAAVPAPPPAAVAKQPEPVKKPEAKPDGKPSFKLAARSFPPDSKIEIRFAAPISSKSDDRAWVTIIEADKPDTSYGVWEYVADGARTASLPGPKTPGTYEVRLHTDYPKKSTHVVHRVSFTVGPVEAPPEPSETPRGDQRFSLADTTVAAGGKAELRFPTAMHAKKGESFWITVVAAGQPDSAWGSYEYVKDGATRATLGVPSAAGDYEIRLHANYPTKTTFVVHRAAIRVE
jgi:serine/threonine-protein kinase